MASKDMTEKALESFNDVFADVVNGLLFNGEQVIKEDSLSDAQTFSMYKMDRELHEQDRDVAKYWNETDSTGVRVRISLLGIENETNYESRMPLRVISYDGAGYRAQLHEKRCWPVITLVLYFGDKPWGKNRTLYDVVEIPEKLRPFVNDYKINLFEIAHLPEEAIGYFHSDFRIVVDYFVHIRKDPDYRPKNPEKFRHVDELLKMMAAITHDDRFTEVLEGGKPKDMCEVLDRVEKKGRAEGMAEGIEKGMAKGIEKGMAEGIEKGMAEGIEKGMVKGIEKGIEKGRVEGIEETRVANIKNIMEGLSYTAQQAMELLKIPMADRSKYLAKL